nr:recombination protein NinB [uncultured Rhodoferax sp.]
MKATFILAHDMARANAVRAVQAAPAGFVVQVSEPNRTLEQNAAQWPYLAGFAQQKQLCINGQMEWVTDDDWKDVLTGCWNGEMRMAAFDGRVMMLPQRTSKMGKGAFSTWMEFLVAMAAQSGVQPVYKSAPRGMAV